MTWSAGLEGNIIKYNLYKIFTKRVFLPLIAIFLTEIGDVTLAQLGIIASVTAFAQLILEIPSGYISDKWGHKSAMVFGSALSAVSVLPYIFMPNFYGGLLASVLFFCSASFVSGTVQAFIHETLLALNRETEYAKIMGRGQSYGLLGNILLISLVPLTYQLNPLLPFIIGFFCHAISCALVVSFVNPPQKISIKKQEITFLKDFKNMLSEGVLSKMFFVFMIFGISSTSFNASNVYREIVFKTIGIPVEYFGFILAFGSLLGAIAGYYIHTLKKLRPLHFYLFDILYVSLTYILIGVTESPIVIIIAFSLFPAYDRTRSIIFESHVFEEFPKSEHKATLISILNFFKPSNGVWIPAIFAYIVSKTGVLSGHLFFGVALLIILLPLLFAHNKMKKRTG